MPTIASQACMQLVVCKYLPCDCGKHNLIYYVLSLYILNITMSLTQSLVIPLPNLGHCQKYSTNSLISLTSKRMFRFMRYRTIGKTEELQ